MTDRPGALLYHPCYNSEDPNVLSSLTHPPLSPFCDTEMSISITVCVTKAQENTVFDLPSLPQRALEGASVIELHAWIKAASTYICTSITISSIMLSAVKKLLHVSISWRRENPTLYLKASGNYPTVHTHTCTSACTCHPPVMVKQLSN